MPNIDIAHIAKQLGKAIPEGKNWRCICPVHDDHNPSLSLAWDERTQTILLKCWAGCPFESIARNLRKRGLLSTLGPIFTNPPYNTLFAKTANHANSLSLVNEIDGINISNPHRTHANELWERSLNPKGSLVEAYLKSRKYQGEMPLPIRYSPHCWHRETQRSWPAMIAAITCGPQKELIGIHRTYLKPDGSDKASIEPNKMMLGNAKGGSVQLFDAKETLIIAEGIETALSVHELMKQEHGSEIQVGVWAALSASFLSSLVLPRFPLASEIIIAADHDPAGLKAAHKAAEKWTSEGRGVSIECPPEEGFDFNDLLKEVSNDS